MAEPTIIEWSKGITKAYVDKQEGNGPIELPLVAILVAPEAMAAPK